MNDIKANRQRDEAALFFKRRRTLKASFAAAGQRARQEARIRAASAERPPESAPSLKLSFSVTPEELPNAVAQATANAGAGPASSGGGIVNLGADCLVDLRTTPLLALTHLPRFKGATGQPAARAHFGRVEFPLSEEEVRQMRVGICRFNQEGGTFAWLLGDDLAVNLALVTLVKTAAFGRKLQIKFAGGEAVWTPKSRAEADAAVKRFAQAQTSVRSRAPASPK